MCGTKQNASKAEALDSAGIQTGKKRRKAGEPMAKVKGTRGYKSYHGRSGGKKLLVVLLVLALAAAMTVESDLGTGQGGGGVKFSG